MAALRGAEIVLEICPTSNLLTKALPDEDAVRDTFRTFVEHGVQFTIATDGPEMMRTHLRDEFELLLRIGALEEGEPGEAAWKDDVIQSLPFGLAQSGSYGSSSSSSSRSGSAENSGRVVSSSSTSSDSSSNSSDSSSSS